MKSLVVEDNLMSRILLQKILAPYGETHVAVDGKEAIIAFRISIEEKQPYDLICLDIMMPEMDGHAVLKEIRKIEDADDSPGRDNVKIVMTTAMDDSKNVMRAFKAQCDGYLVKPFEKQKFFEELRKLGLPGQSAP